MKLKLDENLPSSLALPLQNEGHDVATVPGQNLSGHPDTEIYQLCRAESRILVSMDLDYSNPLRFPVAGTPGIIILRPPGPVLSLIRSLMASLPALLRKSSPAGRLWIVEPGRLRIHDPSEPPTSS